MSVKDMLEQKQRERAEKRAEEQRLMMREAAAHRDQLTAAIEKIDEDLEGLDVTKLDRGQWKIRFGRDTVYVECRWHYEEEYDYDDRRVMAWNLKVGLSTREINVPDCYCGVDGFAEYLSDYLLRLS